MADPGHPDLQALRAQQVALDVQKCAISAQAAAGSDDAVAGDAGITAVAHDRPNGARSAGRAGQDCHVSVGRDPSARNAPDDGQHARAEVRTHQPFGYRPTTTRTRTPSPPRLDSPKSSDALLTPVPSASGTTVHCASPAIANERPRRNSTPPSA